MERVDAVVIGAGVIGLAVGRALALRGLETIVLEREDAFGTVTSSRNSEVIHAGLYYPSGSLKARLCVAGRDRLYAYCADKGIAHRRCGKLLVASGAAQCDKLAQIQAQGLRNGAGDLQRLDAAALRTLEPELRADAALWSPATGIVDSHALMLALLGDLEAAGGALALRSPFEAMTTGPGGNSTGDAWHALQIGGDAPMTLEARFVVNAAGLWACSVAQRIAGLAPAHVPRARYAKGHYFALAAKAPFRHLVYPVPEAAGLGVHLTLDLAGQARFGPDVEWITPATPEEIDYRVDPARTPAFEAAIRDYWPGLPTAMLQPAYSGVRPKLEGHDGRAIVDFVLQGPGEHGIAGLVNLYGIESPGLTACLALADAAADALLNRPATGS
ncbi:MAG TPA: NAD(P)/FAD-dependent oxidoreductase [Burkholderiaceae bacterium]|nr:NAD(P)/FAD-dependent oxidoreductase [Burkholderiaceae bacterium]